MIILVNLHWINQTPKNGRYQIRVRHRAPLAWADLELDHNEAKLTLDNPERAIAPGQSIVIYDGETCLGGGIVV
jgi:tRNA-specific 2-thiouridylase